MLNIYYFQGYDGDGVISCEDINECELGISNCDFISSKCVNNIGGFECRCLPDYSGENCKPTKSCDENTCDVNANCLETKFGPECHCNAGFTGKMKNITSHIY